MSQGGNQASREGEGRAAEARAEGATQVKEQAPACTCGFFKAKSLKKAAEKGCLHCCTEHVDEAGRPIGTWSNGSALMVAAEKGHLEIAKLLVGKEAGMQDKNGKTALMFSAQSGHLEVVELLAPLEAKMKDKDGRTALMLAAQKSHEEVAALLAPLEAGLQTQTGYTALMFAASNKLPEVVKLLLPLEKGRRTRDGCSALYWAFLFNQNPAIELLWALPEEREGLNAQMLQSLKRRFGAQ